MPKSPRTEPSNAPVEPNAPAEIVREVAPTYQPPVGPRYSIERQGQKAEPYVRRLPQVRGGICEFCGVMDSNIASEHQYKLCPHYRGLELRCSYCDESKNPDDVAGHSTLNVAEHPDNPNRLIVWCNSYKCSQAHEARFKRNR